MAKILNYLYLNSNIRYFREAPAGQYSESHHVLLREKFSERLEVYNGWNNSIASYRFFWGGGGWVSQLSNDEDFPGNHDEVDIEFQGTTLDKPYTLQMNMYLRGSGDENIIGREMRFHLWFDPTQDFHQYAILWNPVEIIFLVDDMSIRRYPRKSDATFPSRPMWVYGSIWDASSWETENGKYKADYQHEPFVGQYMDFVIGGCTSDSKSSSRPPSSSKSKSGGLSKRQNSVMDWIQGNYMACDYCQDPARNHTLTPEC